jgi:hypothetical protein
MIGSSGVPAADKGNPAGADCLGKSCEDPIPSGGMVPISRRSLLVAQRVSRALLPKRCDSASYETATERFTWKQPHVAPTMQSGAEGQSGFDVQGAGAACRATRFGQRLVHDLTDGADTPAASGATAEASIYLAGRAQLGPAHGVADLAIAQHITGADDHREFKLVPTPAGIIELMARPREVKEKRSLQTF